MSAAQELKARMRADLLTALKAKQAGDVTVLRSLLAAIDNAEAPPIDVRRTLEAAPATEIDRLILSDNELADVLLRDIEERETAADELAGIGQQERADALLQQAEIVRRYLTFFSSH